MANFNRVIIIGNLTRDPEYSQLPSGQGLCKLALASNRQFKNKATGVLSQEVCFVNIAVWGAQAESCNQYLQKGRPILVEGRLKFDSWKDADGNTRSKHSIVADRVVFLGSRQDAEAGTSHNAGFGATRTADPALAQETATASQAAPQAAASTDASTDASKTATDVLFKEEAPFTDDLPF